MHYLLFYTSAAKHLAHLSSSAESTAHNLLRLSSVWREKVEEDLSWLALTPQRKYSQRADHSVRTRLDGSKESRHQAPLVSELTGTRYRWVLRWLEERRGISDSSTARRLVTLSVECSRATQSYHSLRHISHLTVRSYSMVCERVLLVLQHRGLPRTSRSPSAPPTPWSCPGCLPTTRTVSSPSTTFTTGGYLIQLI